MKIIKRDGTEQEFNIQKIRTAIQKAFHASKGKQIDIDKVSDWVYDQLCQFEVDNIENAIGIETIQDLVEDGLMKFGYFETAKSYIKYRKAHEEARFIRGRINYMQNYSNSNENASTSSETDSNANVTMKNAANLEGEVYKTMNRLIQRQCMKDELNKLYPEVADQYEKDLENKIIYVHDEASTPVRKPYCKAVTLYPMMLEGTGNVDGVTPSAPNDIQSFSGQVTNLVFLLSSQCKGAVALGDYQIALNYYVIAEFGKDWYDHLNDIVTSSVSTKPKTIKDCIRKGMKQFIYGVNQPAGNRSYNSPFSNISYYDKTYFNSLFEDFVYPDGTKPEWKAIDTLQRIFMELHRELRLIKPLTFPVTTMALVHNGQDVIDKEYKKLCADEWAKGGSFFLYLSDNPTSLASCCRVLNEIQDNTFNSTLGLMGIMTGSANVITLNLNRIIQNWHKSIGSPDKFSLNEYKDSIKSYLLNILERVYKYHIAYKTMLYDEEDRGMYSDSNAGYIYMKKLYSTVGLIGYCEAAQYLGYKISNNQGYRDFLSFIFKIVKDANKAHGIHDAKRPFLFNSEAIPGEGLATKLYNWDKKDEYYVPEDQNLYSSYFFLQWDNQISILDKLKLHGSYINSSTDGGQACHLHMNAHLSSKQYEYLINIAIKEGVNYFTFNIPMSECKDCGHVVNAPIKECPICHSKNIDWWIRIIGYLRPLSAYDKARYDEAMRRVLSDGVNELKIVQ